MTIRARSLVVLWVLTVLVESILLLMAQGAHGAGPFRQIANGAGAGATSITITASRSPRDQPDPGVTTIRPPSYLASQLYVIGVFAPFLMGLALLRSIWLTIRVVRARPVASPAPETGT